MCFLLRIIVTSTQQKTLFCVVKVYHLTAQRGIAQKEYNEIFNLSTIQDVNHIDP